MDRPLLVREPARRSMTARAALATAPGPGGRTVLAVLRSDPPLTLRRTGPARVHLVSTAAGPLGGDELALDIDVAPGTALDVRSVASTLVLPGHGAGGSPESLMTVTARVGAGASLRFAPEPTVLAAGCRHRVAVRLALAAGARVLWREEIVLGRYGEPSGRCHSRFDAVFDGRPLLRQELATGDPEIDGGPAVYGGARCVGSTLIAGPTGGSGPGGPPLPRPDDLALPGAATGEDGAATGGEGPAAGRGNGSPAAGDGWAVLPLAGPGALVTALAGDAVELRRRLELGESHVTAR
ncbi:urease accessory protein UreD [Planomonospora corallina]|uniref:Urease accessory protein UreD n=1 Tax=Planomonospora corallina TaxID=1806052 RepID=A0ABV8I6A8_9ACTN